MTREEALAKLKPLQEMHSFEEAHVDADEILCELLQSLGYGDVVDEYEKVGKWYA